MSLMNIMLIVIAILLFITLIIQIRRDNRTIKEKMTDRYTAQPGYLDMRLKVGLIIAVFFIVIILLVDFGLI